MREVCFRPEAAISFGRAPGCADAGEFWFVPPHTPRSDALAMDAGGSGASPCNLNHQWMRICSRRGQGVSAREPAPDGAAAALLYDEAVVPAQMQGDAWPAKMARQTASRLLDAAIRTQKALHTHPCSRT